MGHSDEWTFADYFKYEKEIYRAIISAAVLCQWIAEHDTPPTDGEAEELAREIDRRLCEAWGEIFCWLCWNGGTASNSGPSADCEAAAVNGGFFCTQTPSQSEFMEVYLWNFSIVQLILCRTIVVGSAERFAYGAASIFWRDTGGQPGKQVTGNQATCRRRWCCLIGMTLVPLLSGLLG